MARAGGTAASARRSGRMRRPSASGPGRRGALAVVPRVRGRGSRDRRVVRGERRRRLVSRRADAPGRDDGVAGRAPGTTSCALRRELGDPDDEVVTSSAEEVRAALRLAALPRRRALPAERDRAARRGSRSACAAKLLERGVRIHERTQVTQAPPRTATSRRAADASAPDAAVLAVNARASALPRLPPLARRRLQPHRPHRAGPRRARGARVDGRRGDRRQPDARPLHANHAGRPDRVRLGRRARWASTGRSARRLELDPKVIARARESIVRFFPQLRGRSVTHAWGGPIDVSPTHLPIFGSRGRVHHGFGFTGNGVGPSYLGGEILARLALDRRDERTRLAIVEPLAQALPARAVPLRRRLADPPRARREGRGRGRGTRAGRRDGVRRGTSRPPRPPATA